MRIAFYAPMKPVDHPTPSGDRQVARLLIRALRELGHDVGIASSLRTWLKAGSPVAQRALADQARDEAERLLAGFEAKDEAPELWLTYHLYHRAPDWIGPRVAEALGIPYLVVEASRAKKRARDEWAEGFAACERSLELADAVVAMHSRDRIGLAEKVAEDRLFALAPFIDTAPFAPITDRRTYPSEDTPRLLTVAMMREGQKDRAYAALAEALPRLAVPDWHLWIAGDGVRREAVLGRFDPARMTWLGVRPADAMADIYLSGDLFVWPAIKEAYGLVFLEAQATGLPVVGGDAGGVPEIVADGVTGLLTPEGDIDAFAEATARMMADPGRLAEMGRAAARHAREKHDIEGGKATLERILATVRARQTGYAS